MYISTSFMLQYRTSSKASSFNPLEGSSLPLDFDQIAKSNTLDFPEVVEVVESIEGIHFFTEAIIFHEKSSRFLFSGDPRVSRNLGIVERQVQIHWGLGYRLEIGFVTT